MYISFNILLYPLIISFMLNQLTKIWNVFKSWNKIAVFAPPFPPSKGPKMSLLPSTSVRPAVAVGKTKRHVVRGFRGASQDSIMIPYGSNHRTSDDQQGALRNARYLGSLRIYLHFIDFYGRYRVHMPVPWILLSLVLRFPWGLDNPNDPFPMWEKTPHK